MTENKQQGVPARADVAPLYTIGDLESLLRVCRRTIGRWVKKGLWPAPFGTPRSSLRTCAKRAASATRASRGSRSRKSASG